MTVPTLCSESSSVRFLPSESMFGVEIVLDVEGRDEETGGLVSAIAYARPGESPNDEGDGTGFSTAGNMI